MIRIDATLLSALGAAPLAALALAGVGVACRGRALPLPVFLAPLPVLSGRSPHA